MALFKHRADYYFWTFALVILIKGLVDYLTGTGPLSLNIGDTYYVAEATTVCFITCTVFVVIGFIYRALYSIGAQPLQKLTKLHTGLSYLIVIIFWVALPILNKNQGDIFTTHHWYTDTDLIITLLLLLFCLTQFLLVINATACMIKKLKAGN
ncbi:MAG: hypothetical protein V4581_07340 [Bacteroidota bacterium]